MSEESTVIHLKYCIVKNRHRFTWSNCFE